MDNSSPFFVLGNPRSGTSLFRLMLNNHPEVVVPPECGFAEWLYAEFYDKEISEKIYREFLGKVFESRKFETWQLNYNDVLSLMHDAMPKNYQQIVCEVYRGYAKKSGKDSALLGDKNNYYIKNVDKIEKIFPGCKKIFIVRDGRDVACSYVELESKRIKSSYRPNLTKNIEDIATEWVSSVKTMLYWVGKGGYFIRYEDLVRDPVSTLSGVCEYLSVGYSPKMLNYYNNNDEPEEFYDWKGKTLSPVSLDSVGRYGKELSRNQLIIFERCAAEALKMAGYRVE